MPRSFTRTDPLSDRAMPTPPPELPPRDRLQLCGRPSVAMVAACPFPANRGTPFRILQMGEALARNGIDVHTVTYHLGDDRPTEGMTVHRTRPVGWYEEFEAGPNYAKLAVLDPLLVAKLLQVVRRHRIRIIHAHHFEGALCALVVKLLVGRVQVIYDAHTSLRDELFDYTAFRVPRIFKKVAIDILDSGIPRWCDHSVTVSKRLERFLRGRGVPESRVSCIPMSVNSDEFLFHPREQVRKDLGLPERKTILYTGSLAPFQGIDHLLRAMPAVHAAHPDAQLVLVGQEHTSHHEQAKALGLADHAIHFAGHRPFTEVKRYLNAADVVVLPRDNCVGFPVKLLNYMAAGKAIVAFEGGTDAVIQNLENGIVVPNGDDAAFARGIIDCLSNREVSEQLGDAARRTAAGHFDMDVMTRKVGNLYQRLFARDGLLWDRAQEEPTA